MRKTPKTPNQLLRRAHEKAVETLLEAQEDGFTTDEIMVVMTMALSYLRRAHPNLARRPLLAMQQETDALASIYAGKNLAVA